MPQSFRLYMISMGIIVAIYFATVIFMTGRMKANHNEAWDRLGRFSLFLNNSISNSFKFTKYFIFTSNYKELNDPMLNVMAVVARILFLAAAADFIWGLSMLSTNPT